MDWVFFAGAPPAGRDPADVLERMAMELPGKVLVVEDDKTIRMMIEHAFSKVARVLTAEDGQAGLTKILEHEPDFVISDLSLPMMDGLSMLKKARRTFVGACTPILVLTANDEERVLLDCFREGADDFMVKPFSLSELRVRVSSIYLRQRVARDMNPLTRLPGNLVIKREIEGRLVEGSRFAVAYIDIDYFKPFNDRFGFDQGDVAIKTLAEILRDYGSSRGPGDVFVGHVGGDDFVLLMPIEDIEPIAKRIHGAFSERTRRFYTEDERRKGTMRITTRKGDLEEVPLLSLSIGVVLPDPTREGLNDMRKISQVAAEVKKVAKSMPGNSVFVDRRKKYP
jgi:diguanylate cyclase (GGDEF)-like protein